VSGHVHVRSITRTANCVCTVMFDMCTHARALRWMDNCACLRALPQMLKDVHTKSVDNFTQLAHAAGCFCPSLESASVPVVQSCKPRNDPVSPVFVSWSARLCVSQTPPPQEFIPKLCVCLGARACVCGGMFQQKMFQIEKTVPIAPGVPTQACTRH